MGGPLYYVYVIVSVAGWSAVWQGAAGAGRLLDVSNDVDDPWQVCTPVSDGNDTQPGKSRRDPRLLGSKLWTSHMETHSSWSSTGSYVEVCAMLSVLCLSVRFTYLPTDDISLIASNGRCLLQSAADRTCVVQHTHNIFGDRSFIAACLPV